MDADRFDQLAIAIVTDRRAVGRGILAGAVAALVGRDVAVAGGCAAPGASCKKKADCCATGCKKKRRKKKGKCEPCPGARLFCGEVCCPEHARGCSDGACRCSPGREVCGDFCCPIGTCAKGACVCPGDTVFCDSQFGIQCCAAGDTCDPVQGCVTTQCRAENSGCPDVAALCAGSRFGTACHCAKTVPTGFGCMLDIDICETPRRCNSKADCESNQHCVDASGVCFCNQPAPFGVCATHCVTGQASPPAW